MPPIVLILHGPNLNLLGEREPDIYGTLSLDAINQRLQDDAKTYGVALETFQSNHEGALIDRLQADRHRIAGVVFNPAAYTHTSVGLRDVIAAIQPPVVEVHLSDPGTREEFLHRSFVRDVCVATFQGRGVESYRDGLRYLVQTVLTHDASSS